MTFRLRAAQIGDLEHLYEMAKLTGGGFTNLPADRAALTRKLERAEEAFARTEDTLGDDVFTLVLENSENGQVRGTCQLFTQVGQQWPFYSYRLTTLTQHSQELDRTVRAELLSLVTDLEGSSEVGGLFLHPGERAGGLGLLLARSRYLFIAMHRARFADRILAELRGVIDDRGGSPFWDGVAGRFFGMTFQEADYFNAINGNQFIADLMPKHPVYIAMLNGEARKVIGVPHPSGRAAMRMLERNRRRRLCRHRRRRADDDHADRQRETSPKRRKDALSAISTMASGRWSPPAARRIPQRYGCDIGDDGTIAIDAECAEALGVAKGDTVWSVAR